MTDFTLTEENAEAAKAFIARYPEGRQQSAVMPILDLAQRQNSGWLSDAVIAHVADLLAMPRILVQGVAREISFGLLFINLVLLFPAGNWNRRLFPFFCVVYVAIPTYILMASAGWVPRFIFGG